MPESAEVQVAVDRLAATLDLSVLMEDRRQRPAWWSTRGPVDLTRTSTILDRHVDRQAAEVVRELGLDRADGPVRTPAMPERGMWARWCVPVRHDGHLVGFLWVLDPDNLITDEHLALLQECADLAAEVLAASSAAAMDRRRRREELIGILLSRSDSEAAAELARLEHLPHDVRVQVEAPAKAGGWVLPEGISAQVVTRRPRRRRCRCCPVPACASDNPVLPDGTDPTADRSRHPAR